MQPMATFGLPGQDYLKPKPHKMGLTKINQILKKYRELHKKHQKSWDDAQKRIRAKSPKFGINESVYQKESYDHQLKGNKLLDAMMKELEGHEIFPKKS